MRFEYIHNLRGVAILFVVLAHTISALSNIGSLEYLRYILINCSVFFVVIGGFLFAEISPRYTYKRYLISKFKNVVLPYIIFSLPAVLIYILQIKTEHSWVDMSSFYENTLLFQYFYLMLTGAHLGPLWFIPMIIIFYIMFPVLSLYRHRAFFYFVLLSSTLIGIWVGRPEFNSNVFQSFLYFLPAYLWGIWLYNNQYLIYKNKKNSGLLVTLTIVLCLCCYHFWGYLSQIDLILKLLVSFSLFIFFAQYFDKYNYIFNMCAQLSFFIFFIHGYFIAILRMLIAKGYMNFNEFILVIFNFSVVLACSFIIYYLLCINVGFTKK